MEYRIKWRGYGASHNSWEPESNVLDDSLLGAWHSREGARRGRTPRRNCEVEGTDEECEDKRGGDASMVEATAVAVEEGTAVEEDFMWHTVVIEKDDFKDEEHKPTPVSWRMALAKCCKSVACMYTHMHNIARPRAPSRLPYFGCVRDVPY